MWWSGLSCTRLSRRGAHTRLSWRGAHTWLSRWRYSRLTRSRRWWWAWREGYTQIYICTSHAYVHVYIIACTIYIYITLFPSSWYTTIMLYNYIHVHCVHVCENFFFIFCQKQATKLCIHVFKCSRYMYI